MTAARDDAQPLTLTLAPATHQGRWQDYVRPPDAQVIRTIGAAFEEVDGVAYQNASVIRYGGREYVFSRRAILTLVVVAACNAACRFCSNEITFTPSGPYLTHGDSLERVRDFALLAGVRKLAITGGEPTLQPQKLFDLVRSFGPGFRRIRLHTNGSNAFSPVIVDGQEVELLPALSEAGLTGVSVSVAHFDQDANAAVMRFKKGWQFTPTDVLSRIASLASDRFTPRLSCVMTHSGVATVEDMLEYMRWGRQIGYRKFIFRTCSSIPEDFRKVTEYSEFNAENYLAIDDISSALDRLPGFERTFRQRKSDSNVDSYVWGDISFDVDESSEEVDPDAKVRRINVMPTGVAYTSWIDPLAVLFDDDLASAERARQREFGGARR
ncbi:radical SAM protein [Microbacterium sp. A8/3-1]|uniref:Radical SAM protein n=1 Tax=Microbacterium sp. A8/3-1 TaxID=3160749 RepID=A0AAU7W1B9_9MICO